MKKRRENEMGGKGSGRRKKIEREEEKDIILNDQNPGEDTGTDLKKILNLYTETNQSLSKLIEEFQLTRQEVQELKNMIEDLKEKNKKLKEKIREEKQEKRSRKKKKEDEWDGWY